MGKLPFSKQSSTKAYERTFTQLCTQNIFQKLESLECALDSSNYCLDKAIAERCCISNKEPKWWCQILLNDTFPLCALISFLQINVHDRRNIKKTKICEKNLPPTHTHLSTCISLRLSHQSITFPLHQSTPVMMSS